MLQQICETRDFGQHMSESVITENRKILHLLVLNNWLVWQMRPPLRFGGEDKNPHILVSYAIGAYLYLSLVLMVTRLKQN